MAKTLKNILMGAGTITDLSGRAALAKPHYKSFRIKTRAYGYTSPVSDKFNIHRDWAAVGSDMKRAIGKYGNINFYGKKI